MHFTLAGFGQIANIRRYHFDGVDDARRTQRFSVDVDLELIHRYRIPIQELPLLCRRVLERGTDVASVMLPESDMVRYADDRAAGAGLRKKPRAHRSPAKQKTPPDGSRIQ